MPTVPAYSQLQETEKPLPSARQESAASPALLDAGAVQVEKTGNALMAAGTAANAIMYHMQQRENADAIFRVETDDKAAWLNQEAEIRRSRQGQFAKGATTDTATWWKDRISKNVDSLGNEEAKRVYSQRATELQLQALHGVSNFEGQQLEISHDQAWKADKINSINLAAANPTDAIVASTRDSIMRFNAYQGARKGWDAKVLEAENTADITEMHKQVIQQLAANNKDVASAYFIAHKSEIAGKDQAELGEFAQKATAAAMGSKAAQLEWMTNGPDGDKDAANIDKMAANIREKFKNDTYTRDAALTELKQMKTERDAGIKERDDVRFATVNDMLMKGQSLAAVQQTPAWLALNGTERRKIVEHETQIAAAKESRAASAESRAYTREARQELRLNRDGWTAMEAYSEPRALMSLTRNEVINLRPVIGQDNATKLLNKWDSFNQNQARLANATVDNDRFKEFAADAGLDPAATYAKNKEMALRVSTLRDRVETLIGQEQETKRRELTRTEKDEIMRREIDNTVIQKTSWYKFDQKVPVIALPAKADSYVVVDTPQTGRREIMLSSIPAADRATIIRERKKNNLPITEQAIAEMYLKKNAGTK